MSGRNVTWGWSGTNITRFRPAYSVANFFAIVSDAINATLIIGIIDIIIIVITHVFLVGLIVTSPALRRKLRNQMVVSLTVANLMIGMLSIPLELDFILRLSFPSCLLQITNILLSAYVENFIQFWTVALLLLHVLSRLCAWHVPPAWMRLRCHPYLLRAAGPLYVSLPWLLGLGVMVPVVMTANASKMFSFFGNSFCPVLLLFQHSLAINVVICFMPALFILTLCALVSRMVVKGWGTWLAPPTPTPPSDLEAGKAAPIPAATSGEVEDEANPVLAHVLVALLTVLLMTPYHVVSTLRQLPIPYNKRFRISVACTLLENQLPPLQVLLWLRLLPDLWARVGELWRGGRQRAALCRTACWGHSAPQTTGDTFITFTPLRNE